MGGGPTNRARAVVTNGPSGPNPASGPARGAGQPSSQPPAPRGKLRWDIRILGPSHSAALRRIQHQGLAVEAVRIHHKGVGHDRPQTRRRGIRQFVLPCVPDVVRGVIEAQRALKRRACHGIDSRGPLHVDDREGRRRGCRSSGRVVAGGRPCLRARSPPTGHATTTVARG